MLSCFHDARRSVIATRCEILRHYVDKADGAVHLGPGVQSSLGIGLETNADFIGSLLSKRSSLGQAFGRHAVRRSGDAQRG